VRLRASAPRLHAPWHAHCRGRAVGPTSGRTTPPGTPSHAAGQPGRVHAGGQDTHHSARHPGRRRRARRGSWKPSTGRSVGIQDQQFGGWAHASYQRVRWCRRVLLNASGSLPACATRSASSSADWAPTRSRSAFGSRPAWSSSENAGTGYSTMAAFSARRHQVHRCTGGTHSTAGWLGATSRSRVQYRRVSRMRERRGRRQARRPACTGPRRPAAEAA
jgi:hypothetical protein